MITEVSPGQIYEDRDPRMNGRKVRVLEVKDGKAICKNTAGGELFGNTLRIRLDRLQKARLFRLVEGPAR